MGKQFTEEVGALQAPTGVRHELARSGTPAEVDAALQQGDDKLFEMFMLGSSVDVAALTAGVSRRTAYRRLADPVFRQRLDQARASVRDAVVQRLTDATGHAIDRLWELIDDQDNFVKLQACRCLLDALPKVHEVMLRHSDKMYVSYSVEATADADGREVVSTSAMKTRQTRS